MRNEIEKVIKEFHLNRSNVFEVSKIMYRSVIKKIEKNFVLHGGNIHWSNMGNGFNSKFKCVTQYMGEEPLWFEKLPQIIPNDKERVYVLFEDTQNYKPKYWVYESCIPELICILGEVEMLDDFYIISKKFDWLISECHEEMVSFVGDCLTEYRNPHLQMRKH